MTEAAPVVFIDTETLGLDPDHHPVWDIGLILPDGSEHEWQVRLTPREIALAHPKALEIGRFEERYDETKAEMPATAAWMLLRLIPKGAHLAGAVVSFDEERLRRLLWRWDYPVPWHYHLVDVETLAAGFLARDADSLPIQPPWKSEDLSRLVGVEPDQFDRHTALGDARWAKAIYEAVMS